MILLILLFIIVVLSYQEEKFPNGKLKCYMDINLYTTRICRIDNFKNKITLDKILKVNVFRCLIENKCFMPGDIYQGQYYDCGCKVIK